MDIARYREEYEARLGEETRTARAAGGGVRAAVAAIKDRDRSAADRVAAIVDASPGAVGKPSLMKLLLAILADPGEDDAVRLAALSSLQQGSFSVAEFGRYAADFGAALRSAATDDDPALRERALDILALQGDGYAQRLLAEGLQDPAKALVAPRKALEMIGYDVHAEQYGMLRDLAEGSRQKGVRQAALRLLAADSGSADLFARIAADTTDDPGARATAAVALQGMAPSEFAEIARRVVDDDDDHDGVRATFITALAHGPGEVDPGIGEKVRSIAEAPAPSGPTTASARQLRTSAKSFLRVVEPS